MITAVEIPVNVRDINPHDLNEVLEIMSQCYGITASAQQYAQVRETGIEDLRSFRGLVVKIGHRLQLSTITNGASIKFSVRYEEAKPKKALAKGEQFNSRLERYFTGERRNKFVQATR